MHAISFQLKRAHLCAVAFGRKAVERIGGMTPARFDLLYVVRRVALACGPLFDPMMCGITQRDLTQKLGLARPTVSKMLKRLEQLGWIVRECAPHDRRQKVVRLTKEGLRRIWRAMRWVFRSRLVRHAYEKLFRRIRSHIHVPDAIDGAWCMIDAIARHFGDRSYVFFDYGHEPDH